MDDNKKKNYKPLIFLFVGLVLGQLSSKYIFDDFLCNKSYIDKELAQAANEINKHFPMMVDSETRVDSTIALPGKTFQYFCTLINYSKDQLDAEDLESRLRPMVLNNMKTSSDMEYFRNNEVTMVFVYRDKDGKEFLKLTFDPNEYKE